MKRSALISVILILSVISCTKYEAPSSNLEVTVDKSTIKVGEPVTFKFNGNPDNIVFYSGEYGHDYAEKNNYDRVGTLYFNFSSFVRNGVIAQNISVLVSVDFNGIYDMENIKSSTWYDMSDEFTFSSGKDNVPSGEVNINNFLEEKKGSINATDNIYFAFNYYDYLDETRKLQNEWIIRSSNLRIVSPSGEESKLANMETFGWKGIPKVDITKARIRFYDHDKSTNSSDDWAVSKAYSIGGIPADSGVPLKNISTELNEYTYVYSKPGTYSVVFETSSIWYNGGSTSVEKLIINVVE